MLYRKFIIAANLFFVSLLVPVTVMADWETLPVIEPMQDMQLFWVAENIRYNSLPMSIQSFSSSESSSDILEHYKKKWGPKSHEELVKSKSGDTYVLGFSKGRYYYSIQTKDVGESKSTGTLTVSVAPDRMKKSEKTESAFPLPSRTNLINRIESNDQGVIAENLLLTTKTDQDFLTEWFYTTLTESGWRVIKSGYEKNVSFVQVQKGTEHASVVINPDSANKKNNIIQVNWVKGQGAN